MSHTRRQAIQLLTAVAATQGAPVDLYTLKNASGMEAASPPTELPLCR